jgi:uncharacterized protein
MNVKQKEHPSLFNHIAKVDGEHILFNAFTGNMASVPHGTELNNIMNLGDEHRHRLLQLGFLVESTPEDEAASVLESLIAPSSRMYLIFTIATICDLKCSYCFENREKRTFMSEKTLELSLKWVKKQFEEGRFSDLSVIIFGGEPLLFPNQLKCVLAGLKNIRENYDVGNGGVLLTTNALIGDKSLFEQLGEFGINQIQVSFDGDASITNAQRKSIRFADVYSKTLFQLPMLAEIFDLTIKLNFTPGSINTIPGFMDDLIQMKGLLKSSITVKPEPIVGYKPQMGEIISTDGEFFKNDMRLAKSFEFICQSARERGIEIDSSAIFTTPCMAFRNSSYLLEPDGSLRSCISAFGMDAFSVGNVKIGADHNRQSLFLTQRINNLDTCVKERCAFLPLCGGGCPYEKLLATGKMDGLLCRRDYFTAALPVFVGNAWRTSRHQLYLQ